MTSEERALAFQKRHYLTGITDSIVLMLEQEKQEQREACAAAIRRHVPEHVGQKYYVDCCLNATGEGKSASD